MKQKSVLVVDSTDNIRNVLIRMLRDMNFGHIHQANNGVAALKIIHDNDIDVIISEWVLPKVSGKDLLLAIRRNRDTAYIPFVVCSSSVDQSTVVEALESGVSQYIAKPFSFKVFRERIDMAFNKPLNSIIFKGVNKAVTNTNSKHLPIAPQSQNQFDDAVDVDMADSNEAADNPHSQIATDGINPTSSKNDFSVLIVDDEINNIEIASKCIKPISRVQVALNGEKALQICQKSTPDLILLDIMMPNMDGYEVFNRLQQDVELSEIPVIFLTAKSDDEDIIKGLSLGAVDYVTKPFNMQILKMRVQNQLLAVQHSQFMNQQVDEHIRQFTLKENVERIIFNYVSTPLTQIDETIERINKRVLSSKQLRSETDNISYSTLKINQVINSLNTILKLEEGSFIAESKPINLHQLISEIISHHSREQIKKSIQIDNYISLNTKVMGDKLLFFTMFTELYSNALEATNRGKRIAFYESEITDTVDITLFSASTVDDSIKDNFFDKYITYGKKLGTGLGTYAAKLVTESCNGRIELDAKIDETRVVIQFTVSKH